jgi:ABC-2 type transport system ATP-binding protein
MEEHPMQILIRCDQPAKARGLCFCSGSRGRSATSRRSPRLFVKTRDADRFYLMLNRAVAEGEVNVESVAPVDDDLSAVYQYLIGTTGGSA